MLSQSSISSKGRTTSWASRFFGSTRREPTGGAGREQSDITDAKTPRPNDVAGTK